MRMNIFVGNLSKEVTDRDLEQAFGEFGHVKSVKIIRDMFSGESKGFGFVEMSDTASAQKAMNELNTREIKGKKIAVNEARPKTDDRRGGGGGPRGGGGGGNRRSSGGGSGFGNRRY